MRLSFPATLVVPLSLFFALSFGAQQVIGYWLYVDGAWKGYHKTADACTAAGESVGHAYECRALVSGPPPTPLLRPVDPGADTQAAREQQDAAWKAASDEHSQHERPPAAGVPPSWPPAP